MLENIGFGEVFLIFIFIIIFFGPQKIPDIMKSTGKIIAEFRKAMRDVESEISNLPKQKKPPDPPII